MNDEFASVAQHTFDDPHEVLASVISVPSVANSALLIDYTKFVSRCFADPGSGIRRSLCWSMSTPIATGASPPRPPPRT
jgi:hypothetical protein